MKAVLTLAAVAAAVAVLTSCAPRVRPTPVHQAQAHYFSSDEDRFLNGIMVRAYNSGDTESLKELLLYWQDEHSAALSL
jgi:hypothetical protein